MCEREGECSEDPFGHTLVRDPTHASPQAFDRESNKLFSARASFFTDVLIYSIGSAVVERRQASRIETPKPEAPPKSKQIKRAVRREEF